MILDTSNDPAPLSRLPSWAPPHPREFERLASVCGMAIRDRGTDPTLDEIARRASALFDAPYGLVTLVREADQVYAGNHGIKGSGTPRDQSICAHTILQDEPFVVDDLLEDERFCGLGIAIREPFVRFYAGAPIYDRVGLPLGSLCVLATEPRSPCARRLSALARLAAAVGLVLETQFLVADLALRTPDAQSIDRALRRLDRVLASVPRLVGGPGL